MSSQHNPLNEFILIRTLSRDYHSRHAGVNRNRHTVARFIRHAKLTVNDSFIVDTSSIVTHHITAIRVLDNTSYVVGGVSHVRNCCAIVDRQTLQAKRVVACCQKSLHNFVCFGDVMVGGLNTGDIPVFDIFSDRRNTLEGYKIANSYGGAHIGFNCGRHMAIDKSIAYILTKKMDNNNDALIRLDLKDIDVSHLDTSVKNLKVTSIFTGNSARGFCLSDRYVFALYDVGIIRYCKKSLKSKHFSTESLPKNIDIHQIAANDFQVFACSGKDLCLLSLKTPSLKILDKAEATKFTSIFYRSVQTHTYKGLHFISVLNENPGGVALFVSYRNKLSVACEVGDQTDRPLSLTFDEKYGRLIIGKEHRKSLMFTLTF